MQREQPNSEAVQVTPKAKLAEIESSCKWHPIVGLLSEREWAVTSFLLFLKYLLASHLILFRLPPFLSLGSCNHCNLACFLASSNYDHPFSNHCLWFLNSLALSGWNVYILSNTFPGTINLHLSTHISQWCKPISELNLCDLCLFTASLFPTAAPPDCGQCHNLLPWNQEHFKALAYLSGRGKCDCGSRTMLWNQRHLSIMFDVPSPTNSTP
jgi:hypothetical protein